MSGHREAEETVPVSLVDHGVLRVQVEEEGRGAEQGQGETQHHRLQHCDGAPRQTGWLPSLQQQMLALTPLRWGSAARRSDEESRAWCGNNTDTWGGGRGFTPLLSGLKIQTQSWN